MNNKPSKQQIGSLIDTELYRLAKGLAAIQGKRIGDLIEDALRDYLKKHKFESSQNQNITKNHNMNPQNH